MRYTVDNSIIYHRSYVTDDQEATSESIEISYLKTTLNIVFSIIDIVVLKTIVSENRDNRKYLGP